MYAAIKQRLRRLFTKPKGIKPKFIFTYLVLTVIPLSLATIYGVYYSVQVLEDATLHHLKYELSSKAGDIEKFLQNVHNDISFLSRSNAVRKLVDSKGHKGSAEFELLRKEVESEGIAFARTRPYYYQVRYIDEKGNEIVRVDSNGSYPKGILAEKLQYKGDRYYFTEAMKYPAGESYVSPMDLNVEFGEVQVPHTPVLRFALPVFDSDNRKRGIYIINLYASFLFKQVQELNISQDGKTFLVNKHGLYLSQHTKKGEEDVTLAFGSTESLGKDYSSDVVSGILSGRPGAIKTGDSIVAFNPVHTGDHISGEYWVLALAYPDETIFAPIRTLQIIFVIIGFSAVLSASVMGLWMARRFTDPILKLHEGVEWIAQGDFDRKLDIKTGDEIEQLAMRFNVMADGLKAFRKKMEEWNDDLQTEVGLKTRDLNIEKSKIENIIMSAREGIIILDNGGRVIIINPAAESILNVTKEEMLWKNIAECTGIPERIRMFVDEDPSVLQQPVITTTASKILEINLVPLKYHGERFGARLVFRDITERQKLLEERMTIERQLFHADKLVSLGELSAGIAHEIGNPLASIKTVIQAMNEEKPFTGVQKKYMKRILNEVNRLASFLRTFSVYANPLVNQTAKSRVDLVLREVIFLIKNEALKHNVSIDYTISKYMPHIALDSDQLKQIFINMFINAIQAMPNGGAITVTAASVDLKESGAVITISDTGPGIPVEIIANIFDPFFTTKQTGTGLGLSIVHRIVNEHNGQIRVRSVHGSGTTFEIVLPVASDDSALRQRG